MSSPEVAVGIRSRIHAFEALSKGESSKQASVSSPNLLDAPNSPTSSTFSPIVPSNSQSSRKRSPSPSPPILGRKTSLIDLKEWVLDDDSVYGSPPKKSPVQIPPRLPNRVVSDPINIIRAQAQIAPLIHLESPPSTKPQAPPLPPRKASYSSLKSVSNSNSSSSSLAKSPKPPPPPLPAHATQQLRKKSDSLTVEASYPPFLGAGNGRSGHVPASSISSFHSVSLSSDGGDTPSSLTFNHKLDDKPNGEIAESVHDDAASLDESFENVSTSSAVSPSVMSISHDWGELVKKRPEPPKLPQRPKPTPSSSKSTVSSPSPLPSPRVSPPPSIKQYPPPPPPRSRAAPPPPSNRSSLASTVASNRSSILSSVSTATSRTSVSSFQYPVFSPKTANAGTAGPTPLARQISRPTPVPTAARKRYQAVFVGNVVAQRRAEAQERAKSPPPGRKARQAAGWRGLSVDLVTNPEENTKTPETVSNEVGPQDRLSGRIIAVIWNASRLERSKLKDIWRECDPDDLGSLDREAFIKGMWRIDEELRRHHLRQSSNTSKYRSPTLLLS
ncbi:hypothetical protein K474DRAFT_1121949 [Panus rudis PR-1116 ss-1]|nr:hypothetical protein K474DRAFT_1121949 [Panus rudis PR-1116 ss-1]